MTNEEYLKHLEGTKVDDLKGLYEKIFEVKPPSKFKKAELVKALHEKFCEVNAGNPRAEEKEEEATAEGTTTKTKSRRATIIECIKEHIWDRNTLAEYLNTLNPAWPVNKNKAAISGTIADLRANKGWKCKIDEDGRISVDPS